MTSSSNQPGDARSREEWQGRRPERLLRVAEQHPLLGDPILAEGQIVMDALNHRARELVALRVAAVRESEYIWSGHVYIALGLGALSREDIVRTAVGPTASSGGDADILRLVDCVLAAKPIAPTTHAALGEDTRKWLIRAVRFFDAVTFLMRGIPGEPELEPVAGLDTPAEARRTYAAAAD